MEAQVSRVDATIRRTTTASVVLLAGIAAIVSYRHMHTLALKHGETPWTAALIPLSVDGMIVASSMSLLLDSRRGIRSGPLPWALLLVGSAASLAANVAVAEPTLYGRTIAAWPSLALIGAYELLMRQIRLSTPARPIAIAETPTVQASPGNAADQAGQRIGAPTVRSATRLRPVNAGVVAGGDLLQRARRLDAQHWAAHRRPVSAETLRRELGIGMARARQLRDQVRSVQTASQPTASDRQRTDEAAPTALAAPAQLPSGPLHYQASTEHADRPTRSVSGRLRQPDHPARTQAPQSRSVVLAATSRAGSSRPGQRRDPLYPSTDGTDGRAE